MLRLALTLALALASCPCAKGQPEGQQSAYGTPCSSAADCSSAAYPHCYVYWKDETLGQNTVCALHIAQRRGRRGESFEIVFKLITLVQIRRLLMMILRPSPARQQSKAYVSSVSSRVTAL